MTVMTLDNIMQQVRTLSIDQRKQLIGLIVDTLTEESPPEPARRSILEFEGVGAEVWQAVDVDEYINQMRDEWDRDQ